MKKIKIPSDLTTLAYNSIKQYILEGRVDQESRLTETMLSDQLGISRSPIREALNSLATEGLITIAPRRGASLRRFSVKETSDLYDLRELLEVYSVQTAEVTHKLLATLDKSIERLQALLDANKKLEFIEEDMRFHGAIAAATGNQPLASVVENIQHQIWLCRCKTYNLSSSVAPQAHRSIVNALKKGDRKEAKRAMAQHIDYVRKQLIDFVNSQQASGSSKSSREAHGRQLVSGNGRKS
ncbi:MAG TPA: GntR family transcriptional regulator [Candidatus Acidoferrum sp.]|nr:GntR family transcriptional regulator [Candidatus Acidoferrum sp.]